MNIGQIIANDVANGPGIRLSMFVSGCRIHCKGCFQPQTWDFCYGVHFTDETLRYIIEELGKPQYAGLTILGGEPFEPENQPVLVEILRAVRGAHPEKSVWMYSGCTWDELAGDIPDAPHRTAETDELLHLVDVLVAGPFEMDKKDISLRYRGSSNQQVIDVAETLGRPSSKQPVLLPL